MATSQQNTVIPARLSDKTARNGTDMLDILAHDIMRYEMMSEEEQLLVDALFKNGEATELQVIEPELEDEVSENRNATTTELQVIEPELAEVSEVANVENVNDRFQHVTDEETDRFILENMNKNTSAKTKSDMKIFCDFMISENELRPVEEIPVTELDSLLARFYLGVRKKDGTEYEPDSISSMKNSIDRHLRNLKSEINIKTDKRFDHSNRVLEAKRKQLKSEGLGNKSRKAESLTSTDTHILYEKQLLGFGNPESLLNTVWFNNGVYFGFRGRQDHINLLLGDLELKTDSKGLEYVEFTERRTKTRIGAKSEVRPVKPKMFAERNHTYCPVKIFKLYIEHRPEDIRHDSKSRFYLRPLENPTSDVWFSRQPVGKNEIGQMMNRMAIEAELVGRKVNHSTRKTFATTLLHKERPITEVAQLGGWKSVQTLVEYSAPSVTQQHNASSMLSDTVLPPCDYTDINNNTENKENDSTALVPYESSEEDNTTPINSMKPSTSTNNVMPKSVMQPKEDNCSSSMSMSVASKSSRKDENSNTAMSVLCGATITGGTINLNIFTGKRKHFSINESDSSQE